METILTLKNLNKHYGKVHAVNNLSFDIIKGNIYGILGPNGSGKSTTLGIILNVVNKSSGSYSWFNGKVQTHDALKKVGAIIERPNFYPNMSAFENLRLVCKIKEINTSKINDKLEIVGLLERKDSKFRTFSLGMKQRLAIASALLNDPEILILDEPTNGLDPKGIHEIRSIIQQIAATGTTILLASHLLDEVEKICDHVIVIRNGIKLYEGRTDQMTNSFGFIELAVATKQAELIKLLENHEAISKVVVVDRLITATLNKDIPSALINEFCFKNNIVLSHITKRKPSLESQFLALTSNQ